MTSIPEQPNLSSNLDSLRERIEQGKDADPLAGPMLGSGMALDVLLQMLQSDRGIHAEGLMAVTGFLVGQGVQASLLAQSEVAGLHTVTCRNGLSYLIGDSLNRTLVEGLDSPWELLSEAVRQEGGSDLPPRETLLLASIQRLGSPAMADPRAPGSAPPAGLEADPRELAWLLVHRICRSCCAEPDVWVLFYGLLAARALRLVTPCLAPGEACQLIMVAAIDAARIPLLEMPWTTEE